MAGAFEVVWRDVRNGDNLDLYAVVVIAIVLPVTTFFWPLDSGQIGSFTLLALGLLAVGTRVSRLRIDETSAHVDELSDVVERLADTTDDLARGVSALGEGGLDPRAVQLIRDDPPGIEIAVRDAREEVWLMGVSLTRTIISNYWTLEQHANAGRRVRVLLVDPDHPAVGLTEARVYGHRSAARNEGEIRQSLARLCHINDGSPEKPIEVRTIGHPLELGVVGTDPDTANGQLLVEYYPYRNSGEPRPKLLLSPANGDWYAFYKRQFQTLWDDAAPWNCAQTGTEDNVGDDSR